MQPFVQRSGVVRSSSSTMMEVYALLNHTATESAEQGTKFFVAIKQVDTAGRASQLAGSSSGSVESLLYGRLAKHF